jgi:hypothetical protein
LLVVPGFCFAHPGLLRRGEQNSGAKLRRERDIVLQTDTDPALVAKR